LVLTELSIGLLLLWDAGRVVGGNPYIVN